MDTRERAAFQSYLFPQDVVKDTPQVTDAGVTFTAPGGWSVAGNPSF
jgi:hypothetical protein